MASAKAWYITPALTAFTRTGSLDKAGNGRLYDHLIQGGIDGILVLGSAGEFFSMSLDQRRDLIDTACAHIGGRVFTMAGVGCMIPGDTVAMAKYAFAAGVDAVIIVGPYYINLDGQKIEAYFDSVIDQIEGKVYLYNYPDRTGYDLDPALTRRLLEKHPNIAGYKDTRVDMAHTREVINATTLSGFPDFRVYCGYDDNFAHNVLSGGAGAIGGLSNLEPEIFSLWVRACNDQDYAKAALIQRYVNRMMAIYAIGAPFMPVMKTALAARGLGIEPCCLPPVCGSNGEQGERLSVLLRELAEKRREVMDKTA